MVFPQFEEGRPKVLFFSRGNGRGHAIPDMEIADRLREQAPKVDVRLASYGTGADTMEALGRRFLRLDLPERNGVAETTVLAGQVIGWLKPDLVVSHEEFAALPAAKIFARPTLLITDWFTDPWKYASESLRYADRIAFIDEPGVFEEPEAAAGRVSYVGPVLRQFEYARQDRLHARRELGVPEQALLVAMLPGSWTEEIVPAAGLVLAAFERLPEPKRMIWIAGADHAELAARTASLPGITVLERDWRIDRIMTACDVAITKSNRKTLLELGQLGCPAISLSHGHNPIDERRAQSISGNRMVPVAGTTPSSLAAIVMETAAKGWSDGAGYTADGAGRVAAIIAGMLAP